MAANEKKATIVIKKITIAAAGGHGGSWKVAFADFMTAMMAFFLVMWLVNQSEEVKKSVSDYFSTPSIIEYNFSNYGVELTLEKLFLDLLNEPLKAFEQFVMPADKRPNVMDLGLKKVQTQFLVDKIGDFATNVQINDDEISFDIPDETLFKKNSASVTSEYVTVMERVRQVVEGLKDANIYVNSELPYRGTISEAQARNVAEQRLDLVSNKVEQGIVQESVDVFGKITVEKVLKSEGKRDVRGMLKFRIRQKDVQPKARTVQSVINEVDNSAVSQDEDVYNNFVNQITQKVEGKPSQKKSE